MKNQEVNYAQVIPEKDDTAMNHQILERMIYLAWQNNPDNADAEHNALSYHYEAKRVGWSWLNQLSVQGNLNEFTIDGRKLTNQTIFPRYNIGVIIPIGMFWTQPYATKAARQKAFQFREKVNSQKMNIRNKVTDGWEDYKMYRELLRIQNGITEDDYSDYLTKEKKFKNGEISIDIYKATISKYSSELISKVTLQRNLAVAKSDLERLIGIPLENVIEDANLQPVNRLNGQK